MNKSQQLATMILRAKIKTKETLKQHKVAWNGQEPKIKPEGVTDGNN
jgi:hypothetical protein